MRWEPLTKLPCVRQLTTITWLRYSLSTAVGNTSISGKSFKTTSPRVATSTQKTALKLSYSWTGTRSQPQRTVHRRGQYLPRRGGQPKKGKEKKGSNKPKAIRKDFDKEYFKDLPYFKCGKKGHPQSHCPTKTNDENNLSISSKSNRSSKSGGKPKMKDFENQFKKSFVQLKLAQEGNLSSNSSEEMLHFQYGSRINWGGCLPKVLMDMAFKQSMKGL